MDRYVLPAEAYEAVLLRRDRLQTAWRSTLEPLHQCPMSRKYRKAMASKVDEDAWDLDRDAKFAMSILLPKTIDLLTAEEKPCFQDLLKLSWVKTNRPGIYSCMAWYVDAWGNLHVIIKVGCAWSEDGGLEQRRGQQLNDGVSKAE